MSAEFKSLAEILRDARNAAPVISPLIAEPPSVVAEPQTSPAPVEDADDRLLQVRVLERFEGALQRLLQEIAAEVLGRELLLAPIDVDCIVARLKRRFALDCGVVTSRAGDVVIAFEDAEIDASLGRRFASALERALA